MGQEAKEEGERIKTEFEISVFANDPELYHEMFAEERERLESEEIEWVRPRSENDVAAIMEKLEKAP
jgi:hypothetical protein